jgi:hypothetical protein
MNNIEPTYVTFEQAKWLKEIGFNEYCVIKYFLKKPSGYNINYNKETPYNITGYDGILLNEKYIDNNVFIYASEQWQVVEWLRINHGIWVESLHRGDMGDFIFKVVELNENNWKKHPHYIHNEGFNSPQEAYSAAFDYIKDNNLI